MRKSFILVLAALVMIASACTSQGLSSTAVGPLVSGKLKAQTAPVYIPFSDYTSGNPVIATEAFVKNFTQPGVPQVVSSGDFQPQRLPDYGTYFILFGATKFTMPKISTIVAAGARPGTSFLVSNWMPTPVPVAYIEKCFGPGSTACPTSLSTSDVYLYQLDPGQVWRSMKISGPLPPMLTPNALTAIKALVPATATPADIVNALQAK